MFLRELCLFCNRTVWTLNTYTHRLQSSLVLEVAFCPSPFVIHIKNETPAPIPSKSMQLLTWAGIPLHYSIFFESHQQIKGSLGYKAMSNNNMGRHVLDCFLDGAKHTLVYAERTSEGSVVVGNRSLRIDWCQRELRSHFLSGSAPIS